jgi:hypothetical protein
VVEIIKRIEGKKSKKEQIKGLQSQISFNNWGHLAIRIKQANSKGEADTLVVFNSAVSLAIIEFCRQIQHSQNHSGMPF